jgi:transcription initiation factor IIF auxiliary subunit
VKIVFKKPPFRIDEKGWGEFDMSIVLTAVGKGGDHTLAHDLNFQSERYEAKHQVVSAACVPWRKNTANMLMTDLPESQARPRRPSPRVRPRRCERCAQQGCR